MSEKAKVVANFDAAMASFQPGQAAEGQPAEPVAPPPVERKRPSGNWNIRWEEFQENLAEFGPAVKENFINIVKSGGRKRWSRDVWTVANAALLEIPVVGPIASLISIVGQTGLLVRNEVKKAKSLGKKEYLSRSALKQAGEAMFKTAFKREGKKIAAGKRGRAGGQTEDLVLTNTEAAIAGTFGVCSSLAAIAILEDISLINFIPGMKAAKRLYLAPLLTMLISSGFGALGESYFDVIKRSDKVKDEKLFQQKKAQFVEMVLAVNAPVMQIMTTMGIVTSLAEKAGEYLAAHPKAEVTPTLQPEATQTATPTSEETNLEATQRAAFFATQMATQPRPTETPTIPLAEMPVWHPGQTIDQNFLDQAQNAGGLQDATPAHLQIDKDSAIDNVFRLDLDKDGHPDVWVEQADGGLYHVVLYEQSPGIFAWDSNGDGKTDGWILEDKLPSEWLPGASGGGGDERMLPQVETVNLDLDGDGDPDLLHTNEGIWFIDKDNNPIYNSETDLLLDVDEPPLFHPENGQVVKLVAEDGQMWWRDSEDKMTGLIKDANSKWFIDREAKVLAPDTLDNIRVNGESMTASLVPIGQEDNPEFRVEFKNAEVVFDDGGKWVFDANGQPVGTLANDQNLHLDSDSSHQTGIWAIQHALAVAHPDWSPDEVGAAAFRAPAEATRDSILNIPRPLAPETFHPANESFWTTNDQGQTVGVLNDGRTLSQNAAGGWNGVIQGDIIAHASPQANDLSPVQVGIIAQQAAVMPEFSGSPQSGNFNQLSPSQQQTVFQVYNNQMALYSLEKMAADYIFQNHLEHSSREVVNIYLQDHPLMPVNTGFSPGNVGKNFLDNFGIDPDEFERWLKERYV